jgi:hypothetical protein
MAIAIAVVLCLSACLGWAQDHVAAVGKRNQTEKPCTSFPAEKAHLHDVPVIAVSFSGNVRMPIADQNQIAGELKDLTYSEPLTGVTDELLERVRRAWQDRGYFQVEVNGDAGLTSRGGDRGISLSVHVDEGPQFRLGGISFQRNNVITNINALRGQFPIENGAVFSRSKVAEGLDNLRKVYGQVGYLNYTGVPNTKIDAEKRRIYVVVDIDEGKQFYVDEVKVVGLDDAGRRTLLKESALQSGNIYNARLDELFLGTIKSLFPDCGCNEVKHNQIDERRGTVILTYDLRSCSVSK